MATEVTGSLREQTEQLLEQEEILRQGGGPRGVERQHRLGRLVVRERLDHLLDKGSSFLELGLWAGYKMYEEWGEVPAAGLVTGVGQVCGRRCMVIANDATVKAGAAFPQTIKKFLRAQRIAYTCRLPLLYLVDSSGVFLPLQDEIFPDEDDFGRIFRNNSVLSAAGIPQIAAVMGNCIAGGAYLPVLCDKLLMTKGSGLYLAGPALVKAAIGQEVGTEELGGAEMHATISGTVDFLEEDDPSCLKRVRQLVDLLPQDSEPPDEGVTNAPESALYKIDLERPYDVRTLLLSVVDADSLIEYKPEYGRTLVTAYAKIGGIPVGIVASQRLNAQSQREGVQLGGVIYDESADKAARFVMDCNQSRLPLLFLQDVMGFMVGRNAEQAGIIRCGAKLVNAISNSVVPKITVVIGNSFGAGNYALCGKAYDPAFLFAWPGAKYAVMGGDQAAATLFEVQKSAAERRGQKMTEEELEELYRSIRDRYREQVDIRYGAARGWVDAMIAPHRTREVVLEALTLVGRAPLPSSSSFHTGVLQV